MNEYTASLLRHLFTSLGAILIAKGYADSAIVEALAGGAVAVVGIIWAMVHKANLPKQPPPVAPLLLLLTLPAFLLAGCAYHDPRLKLTTVKYPDGRIEETRETSIPSLTLFDGKNTIDKLRVSNGKTQGVGMGSFESESSGTNLVPAIEATTRLLQTIKTP